ncbi:carboxypeptidase regulatory-like domain-containing protein [Candidatus Hydrogenedentota bacterium]
MTNETRKRGVPMLFILIVIGAFIFVPLAIMLFGDDEESIEKVIEENQENISEETNGKEIPNKIDSPSMLAQVGDGTPQEEPEAQEVDPAPAATPIETVEPVEEPTQPIQATVQPVEEPTTPVEATVKPAESQTIEPTTEKAPDTPEQSEPVPVPADESTQADPTVVTAIVPDAPIEASCEGFVYDHGFPLPGAMVSLVGTDGTPVSVETTATGQYKFENLTPGTYTLSAAAPDPERVSHTPLTVGLDKGESLQHNFRETQGLASLSGTVHIDGRPAAHCLVAVREAFAPDLSGSGSFSDFYAGLVGAAKTDGAGAFHLEELPAGTLTVVALTYDMGRPAASRIRTASTPVILRDNETTSVELRSGE